MMAMRVLSVVVLAAMIGPAAGKIGPWATTEAPMDKRSQLPGAVRLAALPGKSTDARDRGQLALARSLALHYGTLKQINARDGKPVSEIGRTPGSACSVLRFLVKYQKRHPNDDNVARGIEDIAEWVMSIQATDRTRASFGSVPSTPDLEPPANAYYYTIDAALCGDAMSQLYQLTDRKKHLESAVRFGEFLKSTLRGPNPNSTPAGKQPAFCEYLIDADRPLWNCSHYVKNLIALPVLKRLTSLTGDKHYAEAAQQARGLLVEGLRHGWEYAVALNGEQCPTWSKQECKVSWHRVSGPHHEPDMFVYGDTIAYGLRGLFEYEGASNDLIAIYRHFSRQQGRQRITKAYDGRVAFAGYLDVPSSEPDAFSKYYDIVTLGILHELKRAIAPEDYSRAQQSLEDVMFAAALRSWKIGFDLELPTAETIDMTTVANLGEALLESTP